MFGVPLGQNDLYNFPVLTVCMDDGTGCGFSDNSTTVCVSSALEYSQAHYLDETVNATLSEVGSNGDV